MHTRTRTYNQPTKVQNKFKIQNSELKIFILRVLIAIATRLISLSPLMLYSIISLRRATKTALPLTEVQQLN